MQQELIKRIQQNMTITQANQAFNCSYGAVEGLCDCLSRILQTALWLDNPDVINNQQYREEMLKSIREQAADAFKNLPQYMWCLQQKKQSLTSTAKVLQEKIEAAQVDAQQIEQNFPKLAKLKQLEEQANLLLQQIAALLASKQQVDNPAPVSSSSSSSLSNNSAASSSKPEEANIDVASRDTAVKIIDAEIEKANIDDKKRKRHPSPPL